MRVERIPVDSVEVGPRVRALNEGALASLMASIERLGQLQPITVYTVDNSAAHLIAGMHRLEAMKRLGREDIDAVFVTANEVDRELHEIAENLHRAELTALERDEQIARWIELTQAKIISAQVAQKFDTKNIPRGPGRPESGLSAAARDIGVDRDSAMRAKKVASIADDAKEAARQHNLDDNRSALLDVARQPVERQVERVREIAAAKEARSEQPQSASDRWRERFASFVSTCPSSADRCWAIAILEAA